MAINLPPLVVAELQDNLHLVYVRAWEGGFDWFRDSEDRRASDDPKVPQCYDFVAIVDDFKTPKKIEAQIDGGYADHIALHAPTNDLYVVSVGDAFNGITLYGPFAEHQDALDWTDNVSDDDGDWHVIDVRAVSEFRS